MGISVDDVLAHFCQAPDSFNLVLDDLQLAIFSAVMLEITCWYKMQVFLFLYTLNFHNGY